MDHTIRYIYIYIYTLEYQRVFYCKKSLLLHCTGVLEYWSTPSLQVQLYWCWPKAMEKFEIVLTQFMSIPMWLTKHTTFHPKQAKPKTKTRTMTNNIKAFSVAQVSNWLEELGIPSKSFIMNKIDGSALLKLSHREIADYYGLTTADATRLQSELGQTKFSSHHERTIRTLEYLQQENESLHRENDRLRARNDLLQTKIAELRNTTRSGMNLYNHSSPHRTSSYKVKQ
jgi:hypothetical protein